MRILLLEDDQILSETLQLFLEQEGYKVDIALSMQEAEELSYHNKYDLYLLDINLPFGSGLELLKNLRHAEDLTPTIFITALDDLHSLSLAFDLGAIDYIKKPFKPQELLIRIQAKLKKENIIHQDLIYEPQAKIIRKNGKIIDLGPIAHKVFVKLIENRGKMVSKEELCECLEHPSDTALRVTINKIKQRLNIEIKNIRGRGYLIEKV